MRFGGTCLVGLLCGSRAISSLADEDSARPDFSILTPAIQGRYFVSSQADVTALIPPYMEIGKLATGGRTKQLRALVEREGYDPAPVLADRLVNALARSSYQAVHEPIPRKSAGSLQTLSWSDLPEKPQGKLMLDLTVQWICLCADIMFSKYYPAISMSWRLLDPADEVVQPSRTLTYYHFPAWYNEKQRQAAEAREAPPPAYPVETVSESCGFKSVKTVEQNPEVLWDCFGEAFDAAARRLVVDLQRVHPPREAPTASAGTPSGRSTR